MFSEGILQGAHEYLIDSLNGEQDGSAVDELFNVFETFSRETHQETCLQADQEKDQLGALDTQSGNRGQSPTAHCVGA